MESSLGNFSSTNKFSFIPSFLYYLWLDGILEKEMAMHSSPLAWKIPWTEEPGGLQPMGSQRVGHDWATPVSLSDVYKIWYILLTLHFKIISNVLESHKNRTETHQLLTLCHIYFVTIYPHIHRQYIYISLTIWK